MALTAIHPAALGLLALLPALWALAWATRRVYIRRIGRWRYAALVLLRSLILAALALALAGAQLVRGVGDTAVVFLIDGSASVSPALREQALAYVNAAMAGGAGGDQAAVVVFGADAAVERVVGPPAPLRRLASAVVAERSDLADAIQLGLALLPGDAQKRLVLLSDGGENEGRAIEAARLAALRGVPIAVLPLRATPGPDVLLAGFAAPASAREGQQLPLELLVESSVRGPARLEIFADGQLLASEDVQLEPGPVRYTLRIPAGAAGFRRLEARVSAPADSEPRNNRAAAFSQVIGPPRVLLVASAADRAGPFRAALEASGLRPSVVAPAQIPTDPAGLRQYAAVALVDVPAAALSSATQRALVSYVQDQGGGLLMIGGSQSFGAGGWRRSLIADILPVELDPPALDQRPDLALVLVIDRSGSMAETSARGAPSKLALAKEAVYQASLGLASNDQIGLVVFDDLAQVILPAQPLPELNVIEAALSGFGEGGGTNIRSGIAGAATMLAGVDARVKHVILLTDGLAESNYADLVDQLRTDGVTLTAVSIGADADPNLAALAARGGGAFYRVLAAAEVPQLFLQETVRVAGRDIVEGAFTPALAIAAPPVRGLGGLPALRGYNASAPRATARTLLVAPDGAPILALWQRGLGRSLAWTSDLKGQWASDWLAWPQFPRFAAGLVDVVLPPAASDRIDLALRSDGAQALLDLSVSAADGRPSAAGSISGRLLDPQGQGADLRFTAIGLGRYRAVMPAPTPGVYLAQVVVSDPAGQPIGAASAGLAVSYSPEYGPRSANPALLADLAALTGGQVAPPPADLFAPAGQRVGQAREIVAPLLWLALALLPLDIALRRLFLRLAALQSQGAKEPRSQGVKEPATQEDAVAALLAAKRRRRP